MASAKCRTLWRALPLALAALLAVGVLPGQGLAVAISQGQIAASESQIAKLETTISNEQQQSAALDEEYLAAQATVGQLQTDLSRTERQLATTRLAVKSDRATLARDALSAYVYDEPAAHLDPTFFSGSPSAVLARSQYENIVVGDINGAVAALAIQEGRLTETEDLEQSQAQQANDALDQLHTLQVANQQAATAAQSTLNQVRGTLATEIAQYAEQQAEAAAALATAHPSEAGSAARQATLDATVAVALGGPGASNAVAAANTAASVSGAPTVAGTSTATGSGAAAVTAAESQLGVPYVWGGESPGQGFDCSGLTQWAWAQAGVSIPRVAADQAAAIQNVPLNALEPGDLLFYYNLDDDNTIDHVVMYVGSGPYGTQTVIQAPFTGSTVSYSPLFTEGLDSAGRP
jgi:peptidoglycan DL-endopeptidase CwlO